MQHKRLNHLHGFSDSKPNSIKIFSLDVPCMAPVMVSAALYWTNSSFSQKDSLESWSHRLPRHNPYGVLKTFYR